MVMVSALRALGSADGASSTLHLQERGALLRAAQAAVIERQAVHFAAAFSWPPSAR
jgi:hypothetical protein